MQTKQTPFFTLVLALFLMVTFISKDLGLIGVVLNYLFIYILAFFAPFISKQEFFTLWGLMISGTIFNTLTIVLPLMQTLFPTMTAYIYSWQYFLMLISSTIFFMGLTYVMALFTIKRRKIRERVGKCFKI